MDLSAGTSDFPERIYHYTDSSGVLGILSNAELRLSDLMFMNDSQELLYARDHIGAAIRRRADELWPDTDYQDRTPDENRASILRGVASYLDIDHDSAGRQYHCYAACFCSEPDLLSQWRGYAAGGGFTIAFKTSELLNIEEAGLVKVTYGGTTEEIERVVEGLAPHAKGHSGVASWHQFTTSILPLVATIKHPSFSEEQEWRLIHATWGTAGGLQFRAGRLGLIPYIVRRFPPSAVAEVMVGPGPHSDARREGIRQLLDQRGFEGVSVTRSASTLR
jgi:hypothetical protein